MSVNAIILKIMQLGFIHACATGDINGAAAKFRSIRAIAAKIIGATC